jgi:hypothetical protein
VSLQPFFSYFGAKSKLARRYPPPRHATLVEPFAGSAGYATRYHSHRVILVEKDPRIAAIWRWLIGASARDVMALPEDPELTEGVRRDLIHLHIYRGACHPDNKRERCFAGWHDDESRTWTRVVRARLAMQVDKIRHWQIIEGDYSQAPDIEATWFIDPPYEELGTLYPQSAEHLDFGELASWCRSRRGQVMVCENEGATWLPFRRLAQYKGDRPEVIWTNDSEAA